MFDDCCCILRQRLKQKSCWNGPIDLQFEKTKTFKQQLTEPYPTPKKLSPSTFHRPRFESFESNWFFVFDNFLFSAAHAVLHGGGAVLAGDHAAPLELAVAVLVFGQRLRLVLPLAAHVIAVLRSVRRRRGVAVPVGFKLLV